MVTVIAADEKSIVVGINKNINFVCTDQIRAQVEELLNEKVERLTMDLAAVEYVDSTGVGMLLGLYTGMKDVGKTLEIRNANANVKHLFQLIKLDSLIHVE